MSPPWPGGTLEAEHPMPTRLQDGDQVTDTRGARPRAGGRGREACGQQATTAGSAARPRSWERPAGAGQAGHPVSDPAQGHSCSPPPRVLGTLCHSGRRTGTQGRPAATQGSFSIRTKHEPAWDSEVDRAPLAAALRRLRWRPGALHQLLGLSSRPPHVHKMRISSCAAVRARTR